jgi:C-terminal processing protease CtpA/Prc
MNLKRALPLFALAALALPVWAIEKLGIDVDAAAKKQTVEALFTSMNQYYVFPDKAKEAEKAVKARLASGAYDGVKDGAEFAKLVTEDMRKVCQDAHLHVRFSETKLPEREEARQPTQAEIAEARRQTLRGNAGLQRVERLPGNVGLIKINGFHDPELAAEPIRAAMDFVANTDALIFDLRDNGGGDPSTVQLLCSYLFGEKPVHLNDIYFRPENRTTEFWTLKSVPGKRYEDREVYVLTSKRTGSGAEEFAYNLKNLKRATIVGSSTWGGANPGGMIRLNDHFSAFVPSGRAINPITKTNWEGVGVQPDVEVAPEGALKAAHVLALKSLLAKAKPEDRKLLTSTLELIEK